MIFKKNKKIKTKQGLPAVELEEEMKVSKIHHNSWTAR